jgi:hypothetical protein
MVIDLTYQQILDATKSKLVEKTADNVKRSSASMKISLAFALFLLPLSESRLAYDFDVVANDQSPRALQTSGGTLPDLIAPTSTCFTLGGLNFGCDIFQRVGTVDEYTDLNATVVCELGVAQFDYRRSNGCNCGVIVTPSNTSKTPKMCPCYVCPVGFGSSSISIDCVEYEELERKTEAPSPATISTPTATSPTFVPAPSLSAPTTNNRRLQFPSAPTEAPAAAPTEVPVAVTNAPVVVTDAPAAVTDTPVAGTGIPTKTPVSVTEAPVNATEPPVTATEPPVNATEPPVNATEPPVAAPTEAPGPVLKGPNSTDYDPFIFATCSSIDCAGNCNGTCSLGCEVSGPQCEFCENSETRPTAAPTGNSVVGLPTLNQPTISQPTINTPGVPTSSMNVPSAPSPSTSAVGQVRMLVSAAGTVAVAIGLLI